MNATPTVTLAPVFRMWENRLSLTRFLRMINSPFLFVLGRNQKTFRDVPTATRSRREAKSNTRPLPFSLLVHKGCGSHIL